MWGDHIRQQVPLVAMAASGGAAAVIAYTLYRSQRRSLVTTNIQMLTETDFKESAKLAAAAFADGKAYEWFGGDVQWRQEQLEWFFEMNFREMQQRGNVCRVHRDDQGRMECFFMLQTSQTRLTKFHSLKLVAWHMLPKYGFSLVARVGRLVASIDRVNHSALEKVGLRFDDCLMLERMVVHPSKQGKGVGTRCLGSVLDVEQQSRPVLLNTQEERNVTFYKRLGFEVISVDIVEELGKNWTMIRRPRV
eukprot:m.249056 g.249056  ORF g.249056 m.249056 type:complete len:249 (+) comp19513_c1_seq1:180-926(+)